MTREHKISLILGFSVVLVVGVLISDHWSGARLATLETADPAAGIEPMVVTEDKTRSDLVLVDDEGRIEDVIAAVGEEEPFGDHVGADVGTPDIPTLDMSEGYRALAGDDQTNGDATYTTHRVVEGETLWVLAQRYLGDGSRHTEIAELNADRLGANGVVRVGVVLRIPGSAGSAGEEAPRTAPEVARPMKKQVSGAMGTYTVKKGDTLSEIAQEQLGTIRRMDEILEANTGVLKSANELRVGMVLKIPQR